MKGVSHRAYTVSKRGRSRQRGTVAYASMGEATIWWLLSVPESWTVLIGGMGALKEYLR